MPKIKSESPEASRVVLTALDALLLYRLGFRIMRDEMGPGIIEDEKEDLLGMPLEEGKDVAVNYLFEFGRYEGQEVKVIYRVSELEPSPAYVGKETTMVIEPPPKLFESSEWSMSFLGDFNQLLGGAFERQVSKGSGKDLGSFTLEVEGNIKERLKIMQKMASAKGINLEGDGVKGIFEVRGVCGRYEIDGSEIKVDVYQKPSLVTIGFFKKMIGDYLMR